MKCKCSVTFSDYNIFELVRGKTLIFPYLVQARLKNRPTKALVEINSVKILVVLMKYCLA